MNATSNKPENYPFHASAAAAKAWENKYGFAVDMDTEYAGTFADDDELYGYIQKQDWFGGEEFPSVIAITDGPVTHYFWG